MAIYDDNEKILVQIEDLSNDDRLSTIRKLSYGLMDQLRWQKNRDRTICSCTGFYFPLEGENEHVVKLECNWSDENFNMKQYKLCLH